MGDPIAKDRAANILSEWFKVGGQMSDLMIRSIEEAETIANERGRREGMEICAQELRREHADWGERSQTPGWARWKREDASARAVFALTKAIQFERAAQGRAVSKDELRIAAAIRERETP